MAVCAKCKELEGAEAFVPDSPVFLWAHGQYVMWCKKCCVEAAIEHIKEGILKLPGLEKELEELNKKL